MLGTARLAAAQRPDVTAFLGYRAGGDPFARPAAAGNLDGASAGVACDVPLHDGLSLEILYTRQSAHVLAAGGAGAPPIRVRASTEYWHAGGLQEFDTGAARPFLTGTIGLTRFVLGDDAEVRFSVAAGGGLKVRANEHLALRLDGRLLVTFIDGSVTTLICAPGRCFARLHLTAAWQTDFTAGLAFAF